MEHQTDEEDDEQMVGVPEDLEVGPADDFHGGCDDEDESQGNDHTRQAGNGGEHDDSGALHQNTDYQTCFHGFVCFSYSVGQLWVTNPSHTPSSFVVSNFTALLRRA